MQITNSEMTTWLGCRRKWLWSYGLGLALRRTEKPLLTGRLVHEALEQWWRAVGVGGMVAPPASLVDVILDGKAPDSSVDDWAHAARSAQSLLPLTTPTQDALAECRIVQDGVGIVGHVVQEAARRGEVELVDEIVSWLRSAMRGYVLRWADDADRYEVVAVEQTLRRKIHAKKASAREKVLLGKPDVIVRNRLDGKLRVVEHKSSAARRIEDAVLDYQVDTQPRAYVSLVESEYRERPVAVVYDFIRKKAPSLPKLVQCKRPHKGLSVPCPGCGTLDGLRGGEKALCVSTAPCDTSEELLVDALRMTGGDPADEVYSSMLRASRQNLYFHREEVFIGQSEIDEYEGELHLVALELADARRRTAGLDPSQSTTMKVRQTFPRNPAYCRHYGRACAFTALCVQDSQEARREYEQREGYHPEYKEAGVE